MRKLERKVMVLNIEIKLYPNVVHQVQVIKMCTMFQTKSYQEIVLINIYVYLSDMSVDYVQLHHIIRKCTVLLCLGGGTSAYKLRKIS